MSTFNVFRYQLYYGLVTGLSAGLCDELQYGLRHGLTDVFIARFHYALTDAIRDGIYDRLDSVIHIAIQTKLENQS